MREQEDNGPPLFTMCILACYIAVFSAEFTRSNITYLWPFAWDIGKGELWRFLTATALHGGVLHLAFNAMLFYRFSSVVENWLGPWVSLVFYVVWAMGSMGIQAIWSDFNGPAIGASGVVYAYFGFLWVMSRRRDDAAEAANPVLVQTLLAWLLVCAIVNIAGGHIANAAHVGGLALGYLTGRCFVAKRANRIPLIAATLAAAAIPVALCWLPIWLATIGRLPRPGGQPWTAPALFDDAERQRIEEQYTSQQPGLFM